jgi:RNA 3'-terminal phosphate cyclase (ATP)
VPHAPTAQYVEHVYLEVLRPHGLNATITSPAAGFYPRGGGRVEAIVEPSTLSPVDLTDRGRLRGLTVYVVTSGLPPHVAERGGAEAVKQLGGFKKPTIVPLDLPSNGQGASVVVVAECENVRAGFSAIGERGKPMERVADDACSQFIAWYRSGGACDEHLADQLVLPMALARGTSRWTTSMVTEHLRTVLWVTRQFLPVEANVEEREDGTGLVTIHA